MRYFTRGWTGGELGDLSQDSVPLAYRAHVAVIAPRLPPAMLRLAGEVDLHDGVIERVTWSPAQRRLRMGVVCGASGGAFRLVDLIYRGARLGHSRVEALKRAALSRQTELLYDEVDISDDGLLCHRILFHPNEEVTLDFEELELTVTPLQDTRISLKPGWVEEAPDAALLDGEG